MIQNDNQLLITTKRLEQMREEKLALSQMLQSNPPFDLKTQYEVRIMAINSYIADLEAQIDEYKENKHGEIQRQKEISNADLNCYID